MFFIQSRKQVPLSGRAKAFGLALQCAFAKCPRNCRHWCSEKSRLKQRQDRYFRFGEAVDRRLRSLAGYLFPGLETVLADLFATGGPARGDYTLWKETRIGNHVSIGSNATILPVTICDNVVIGAGSVVTKDITIKGIYAGNPARFIREL